MCLTLQFVISYYHERNKDLFFSTYNFLYDKVDDNDKYWIKCFFERRFNPIRLCVPIDICILVSDYIIKNWNLNYTEFDDIFAVKYFFLKTYRKKDFYNEISN